MASSSYESRRSAGSTSVAPAPSPDSAGSEAAIQRGSALFAVNCSACHGVGAVGGGVLPDLRFLRPQARQAFEKIVVGGALRDSGMPGFERFFGAPGADAILLYLADRAHAAVAEIR